MKLDLGCGNRPLPGYIGVDLYADAEIYGSLTSVPLPDGCASEIYSSHALEHIRKAEVIPALREWKRLLAPDGTIILRVPDLEWCVRNWFASGMGNGWEIDTIFGSQERAGLEHKTGFTAPMLRFYFHQAGLSVISVKTIQSHGQPTIEVRAVSRQEIER